MSATATARPGDENAAAVPLAATALVHDEFVYSLTVEPASAVPLIEGLLLFAGDAGETESEDGATGAVESSTYVTPVEHEETFPAVSVAVA